MGGALPSACRVGACLVGRLLCARALALFYSGTVIQWHCCALGRCKKIFLVHCWEYFMAFEFYVIYISVKYLIPFYFGNYCDIKF